MSIDVAHCVGYFGQNYRIKSKNEKYINPSLYTLGYIKIEMSAQLWYKHVLMNMLETWRAITPVALAKMMRINRN